MSNEFWIHPELEGRGYSAVKVFEDEYVYVSVGSTHGTYEHDHEPLIMMTFNHADFYVFGGKEEIAGFKEAKDKREWAFRTLLNHLTPEWFQYLLQAERTRGRREGRNEMRRRMKTLLTEE